MQLYLKNVALRPSCYECRAKSVKLSDLTLGDFWGIRNVAPDMDDNKGTSLLIVRTENGQHLFRAVQNQLKYKEVRYEDAVRENFPEYRSVPRPPERNTFYRDLST